MKKFILLAAVAVSLGFGAQAQQKKTGYVNVQEILASMPEYKRADTAMQKYVQDAQAQLKTMTDELNKKADEFDKGAASMSDPVKAAKQQELVALNGRIQSYQEDMSQKAEAKRNDLLKPIYTKLQTAIKAVGTQGSYDFLLDAQSILYAKDSENITSAVKAQLGIK